MIYHLKQSFEDLFFSCVNLDKTLLNSKTHQQNPGVSRQDAEHFHRPKYGVLNVWNDPYGIYGCDSRR